MKLKNIKKNNSAKVIKAALPLMLMMGGAAVASSRNRSGFSTIRGLKNLSAVSVTEHKNLDKTLINSVNKAKRSAFGAFTSKPKKKIQTVKVDVSQQALAFLQENNLLTANEVVSAKLSGNILGRKTFVDFCHTINISGNTLIPKAGLPGTVNFNNQFIVMKNYTNQAACTAAGNVWNVTNNGACTSAAYTNVQSCVATSYKWGGISFVSAVQVAADTTAPIFESSTPSIGTITGTGATLSVDLDEDGTVYYVVVTDGASAPSAAEVKAGTGNGGSGQLAVGNFTTTTTTGSQAFIGLSGSTAYDIYVVAQDDEATPNLQASVTKVDFSTADVTAPTISTVTIPDSAHKVGDTVTATITVTSDADDYTTGSGAINGTIAGYALGSLSKTNDTTYTATFTITDGGTDVAVGNDIPVSFTLDDSSGNTSGAFTTAISQASDAIYANLPDVDLTASSNTIAEDGGVSTLTATLSGSLNNQWPNGITVNLAYTGTGTAATDYSKSDSIVVSAGNSSNTATITGTADTLFDAAADETAIVDISSLSEGDEGVTNQQTITITDAEVAPTVSLTVGTASVAENGGTSTITASLSHETYDSSVVNVSYSGTAIGGGTDYNTPSSSITINAGSLTANAVTGVTAVDDGNSDGNLTIVIDVASVTGSASESGTQQQTITIIDDEDGLAPTISAVSITDSAHKVGDTVTATITVTSDADDYTTGSGGISGTINGYTLGSLSKTNDTTYTATFTITDGGTDVAAGSNIAVNFTVDDSSGNTSGAFTTAISQASDAIYANLPDIDLTADTGTIAEDGGISTLTATLSGSLNNQWPVGITVNLAYSGTGTAGTDYSKSDSIVISSGSSNGTATITGTADTLFDAAADEYAIVDISSVSVGNENGVQQLTIYITDAEVAPTVTLTVGNASVAENAGTSTITAALNHATYANVTVNLGYTGTATSGGTDYNTPSSAITILMGSDSANAVTGITGVDDGDTEGNETIIIDITSVSGGSAAESGTQQQTITMVDDENVAPVANNLTVSTRENKSKSFVLSASDADSNPLTYTILTQPKNGSLAGSTPNLTYTPDSDFDGSDSFTFKANDGTVDSNIATVSISVSKQNSIPIAYEKIVNTTIDTSVSFLVNASDADGDNLTYSVLTHPTNGVLTGSVPSLTYQPKEGFSGDDSFTFKVNDGSDSSNIATIKLQVTGENTAPVAIEQSIEVKEDTSKIIVLTATDAEDDELTYTLVSQPEHGELTGGAPELSYIPDDNFKGSDSFTFKVNDGKVDSAIVTISIEVSDLNDEPVAVDDTIVRENWDAFDIDVLANDTDNEGDVLTIIGTSSDIGTVSFTEKLITYTPSIGFVGQTSILYHIQDANGGQSSASVLIDFNVSDEDLPIITIPDDIEVNATGLFTKVELGIATAIDRDGDPIPVSLTGSTILKPGITQLIWQAVDSEGRKASASQKVTVHPLVSINKNQTVLEGYSGSFGVSLNGTSPSYPLSIPYTVSGSAESGVDHDLSDGVITITSGTSANISFSTFNDAVLDDGEIININLSGDINSGSQSSHSITITEENIAPKVTLLTEQAGESRFKLSLEDGLVKVSATVSHPDPSKVFSYQWENAEQVLTDIDGVEQSFSFSPDGLSVGVYRLSLLVTDLDDSRFSSSESVSFTIVQSSVVLTDEDTDKDGIPDNIEGLGDDDTDGIPNYLDNIAECNVIPEKVGTTDNFLLEGDPGVCLRLGDAALSGESGGTLLGATALVDNEAINTGGIFDFVVYGLPVNGQSSQIVLPQVQPVPNNAVYRKQKSNGEWTNFVESTSDVIWSTEGQSGICPPPGDSSWQQGLVEGAWCVQLKISDGGPNDADGVANGSIVDPGGVAVMLNGNAQPEAIDDESETRINIATTLDVLSNDTDADDDELIITSANALFGSVSIIDNQLYFEPKADFIGIDTLVYGVSDGNGGSSSATVSVTVMVNEAPMAVDDVATGVSGNTISINVLDNDSDAEGDMLTVISAVAENGTVVVNEDNTISYTSTQGFSGIDTVMYQIQDALGAEAAGKVTVTVSSQVVTPPVQSKKSSGTMYWLILCLVGITYFRKKK